MSSERGGTTRRRLLEGAAGVAAAGLLSGTGPAVAEAIEKHHRQHRPLWEIAQQRGIVYGGSISTWMYADDPAYKALFRRQVGMLWPEDDFLWYHLRPSPTSGLDFTYPDMIVEFAESNGQLVIGAPGLVWDDGFGPGWTHNDLWGMSHDRASHVLFSTVRAMVPWSSKASMVCSGSVLTVSGPISVSTYKRSEYSGFLVDVDAHSGRCSLAPRALSSSQRPPWNRWRKSW